MILAAPQSRAATRRARTALPVVLPARLAVGGEWAQEVFGAADLGDRRRTERLVEMAATMGERPTDSLPQAFGAWAGTKGAYRFLENERVTVEALDRAVGASTARASVGLPYLVVPQDTTMLSFPTAHSLEDMGYSNDREIPTLQVHSTLALRPDGVPWGLLHLDLWSRDPLQKGKKKDRKRRPIEDKESGKWLRGIDAAHRAFEAVAATQRPRLIHVFDREGDIYEVFERIWAWSDGAVIRLAQNRCVQGSNEDLTGAAQRVRAQAPLGAFLVDVPRRPGRAARQALVTLRACEVTLSPRCPYHRQRQPLTLHLVEALEEQPAPGVEPLHWLLWTTEPAATLEQARAVVALYALRWTIEDYHQALKSGCRVEALRLHTQTRLERTISIYAPIAVRIVQLRDLARQEPDAPCTQVLDDLEWRALYTRIHNRPPQPSALPPTLRQAILWIGRLGGHLGRKGDGMPGVRTLWRGLRDLQIIVPVFAVLYPPLQR